MTLRINVRLRVHHHQPAQPPLNHDLRRLRHARSVADSAIDPSLRVLSLEDLGDLYFT